MTEAKTLFREAITAAGSQAKLALAIGTTQSHVSYILTRAKRIPPEVAIAIDHFTDGKIAKRDLRPDLFGDAA